MADISITAANVLAGNDAVREHGILGEVVTAGKAVYYDAATRTWKVADNNAGTEVVRKATAIALNGGAIGQPVTVQKGGKITIGGTLTPGVAYYLSDAGGICPAADLSTGEYVCLVGMATTAAVLDLEFKYTGVAN